MSRKTAVRRHYLPGLLIGFLPLIPVARADAPAPANVVDPSALKKLSLEELSRIEVTTPSKEPTRAFDSPSAIFVLTGEVRLYATEAHDGAELGTVSAGEVVALQKQVVDLRGQLDDFSRFSPSHTSEL